MAVFNYEMRTERNLNRRLDFKKRRNIIIIAKYCGWELEDIRHQLDRGGIYVMTPEEWLELERERMETECDPDEIRRFFRAMGVHSWRELLAKLQRGMLRDIDCETVNGIFGTQPFVMVTPGDGDDIM